MNSPSTAFVIEPRSSALISSCLNMVFATVFQFLLEMFIIIDANSCEKELLHRVNNNSFPLSGRLVQEAFDIQISVNIGKVLFLLTKS